MKSELTYDGPAQLRANQLFRAKLHLRPARALRAGGRIVIATRHFSDFPDPQTTDPAAENFMSISVPGDATLALASSPAGGRHPWNNGIDLVVEAGEAPSGSGITIHLGDPAGGCPGYRCQSFAESHFHFRLGIDPEGDGDWEVLPLSDCPGFEIVGNAASCLRVVVPNVAAASDRITVRVKPEDAYGNVAGSGPEEVSLALDDDGPPDRLRLDPGRCAAAEVAAPNDGRWHVVTAATDDGAQLARSNPFGPSPLPDYQLYWGEIHTQSALCDGTNHPAEIYQYARQAAGLDFASVTSHDFELTASDWRDIQAATKGAHVPGKFVTFLGYEWSGNHDKGGDNNIYFLDDDGPLAYSAPRQGPPAWDPAAGEVTQSRNLTETIAALQGRRFMVIPHGGGRPCNFDYYQADCMPLLEVHSCHRSYEHLAHEAIRRGLRPGFIGGSDDHRGAMGDSHIAARDRYFSSHNGLVAAYARDLTRESLWEAFFARRVYATNGARMILDVRLNDVPMGGELRVKPGDSLRLTIRTRLDGWLDRVEIVRGAQTVERLVGARNRVDEFEGEFEDAAAPGATAYYVRVWQTDGGCAWSSPIWVDAGD